MKYKTNTTHNKQIVYGIVGTVLVLAIAASALAYWRIHRAPAPTVATNQGPATATTHVPSGTNNPTSPTNGGDSSKSGGTPSTTLSPGVQPAAPNGQFVSNHAARLSGGAIYSTESSTCLTTPGAYCQIQFQMGDTIRTLPKKLTDANGNVVWESWTLGDVGLSAGAWDITAIASNGSHTASTKDAIQLTVSP